MASKPGHPFWLDVLNSIGKTKPYWAQGKFLEVMYTTGPSMLNEVAKNSLYNFVSLSPILIGSPSICSYHVDTPGNLFISLEGGSWLPEWFVPLLQFFRCSKREVLQWSLVFLIVFVCILLLC
jgi:hypothetical protein